VRTGPRPGEDDIEPSVASSARAAREEVILDEAERGQGFG